MSENTDLLEQNFTLDFMNSQENEILLFLEPEGMSLLIPRKTTYQIVFSHKPKDNTTIQIKGTSTDPYYAIWVDSCGYEVFCDGKLIYESP